MTLTAPPPVQDPAPREVDDAVIKEAKRRARRRRWRNGAVAAAAAALVAWDPPPQSPAPAAAAGPLPAGGPDPNAKLVARFGAVHSGWVLVYSDAYVIIYADIGASQATLPGVRPAPKSRYAVRRLTDKGLAQVRSGGVLLGAFLTDPAAVRGLWVDPEFRTYGTPLGYVACHDGSTAVLAQLPAAAQELLRGTEQRYDIFGYNVGPQGVPDPLESPIDCFALTNDRARALALISTDPGSALATVDPAVDCPAGYWDCNRVALTLDGTHGAEVILHMVPALPDQVLVDARG